MKKTIFYILNLALIFLLYPNIIIGQSEFIFKTLSTNDGLSQSSILCMLQDREGFIWIGTFNGLNKYDGYNFKVFVNDPMDSSSISENVITSIAEDDSGNIWLGTFNGVLNKFNKKNETFERFDIKAMQGFIYGSGYESFEYPVAFMLNANSTITSILPINNSKLLIGTWGNGIVEFNYSTFASRYFYSRLSDSLSLSSNYITKIIKDKYNSVFAATYGGGLNKIIRSASENDSGSKTFFKRVLNSNKLKGEEKILSLAVDKQNSILIGTQFKGLLIYNENPQIDFSNLRPFQNTLSPFPVMSIVINDKNEIWAGTYGAGVFIYNSADSSIQSIKSSNKNINSLCDNEIVSMLLDRSGIFWAGTSIGSGISLIRKKEMKFFVINKNSIPAKLNDNVVWSILEDEENKLWVGTYKGGLNVLDRKTNEMKIYKSSPGIFSISDNHIRSIAEDKHGNLWIGTFSGGLNFYNRKLDTFIRLEKISQNGVDINKEQVQVLYIDNSSIIWIGNYGGGLSKFDLDEFYKTGTADITTYRHDDGNEFSLSDNRVYSITEDRSGIIWIGTYGGGLNKFDKFNNKFISYKHDPANSRSLSDNKVLTVFEDSEGVVWIGTYGGGLCRYESKTNDFENYTENDGMFDDAVYGILEDSNGNLWMSSDFGIEKFDKKGKSFSHYTLSDGLQSMEFSGGAYFKNKKGEMFFGGINGINYFTPEQIFAEGEIPPIVITNIKVLDHEVAGEADKLILNYDQNFFSFEFSALDFTNPDNNNYSYILENFDENWKLTTAKNRIANYTNVPPGEYLFHVKGSSGDGVWNNTGKSITVIISPPYYLTWWFISIATGLLISIIYSIVSFYIKYRISLEKLKTKLAADLHDNVGAGLTEISILSELASNDLKIKSAAVSEKIQSISSAARNLIDTMSDIVWVVNPERDSLHDLLVRLRNSYSEILNEMGITLNVSELSSLKTVKLAMDVKQNIYLILKESINNAIKHSKCKTINLDVKIYENKIEFNLSDDGIGFNPSDENLGNGLINIRNRSAELNTKINIESENSKGTRINFIYELGNLSFIYNILRSKK